MVNGPLLMCPLRVNRSAANPDMALLLLLHESANPRNNTWSLRVARWWIAPDRGAALARQRPSQLSTPMCRELADRWAQSTADTAAGSTASRK